MQRQTFDSGYVQRLAQSDPDTERHFFLYFSELLSIKLRSRLRSPDQIADVTQETFARVLRTLRDRSVDNPEALGSYVNSVCNNILFEVYRQQSRASEALVDRPGEDETERNLLQAEEQQQVRRILAALPDKDRLILCGMFFEEKEKDDLCRTLGVDREYLRVLFHRAKQRFRADWIKLRATKPAPESPMS